ncbi:hypothetical protein [Demequina sp. NBRC 110051]|uniref:hypothetical protein n=1 Tax=Demequina sp. NBRC 110051 TaxID=1570340 RepID=UPI000A019F53|nr:hypothetical protein [Demequina sp. NBRC 110051]
MSVSAVQIRSAAALMGAVPGLVARLTLPADAVAGTQRPVTLVAGDSPDATMCGHDFRAMVLERHLEGEGLDDAHLTLDHADPATGLIRRGGVRWFVSPLPAKLSVATLRDAGHTRAPLQSVVRGDDALGLSVVAVRDQSRAATDDELDAAATAASAACLVAHLLTTSGLTAHPTRTTHP